MLKNKKFVVLLLCLVILAQSAVAMAVTFPDVTKDNNSGWAYDYIMELANKGIIKGYDDGTYKPDNNVTYLETLSLLHGVMNPSRTEINDALSKYRTFLNNNNTPEWAMEIAAVALSRGVVQESEYSRANAAKMIELGTKVSISRYDVAVFAARALELQPKSASNLTYKDAASINSAGAPLIAALIDTQVLHKDGRDGEFLPNSPIKRSEMAKMIKYAYDWTVRNPLKGPAAATETATGTVVSSGTINNKQYMVYKPTNSTQNQSVNLDSGTKVTDRNNNTVAQKDIVNYDGASVTITYKTVGLEKIATEIKFTTDRTGTDGQYTFKSFRTSGNKYYISVANTTGTTSEYETRYNTTKNGTANFYIQDIKENAKVNLKFTNGIVTDVAMVSTQDGDYEVTQVSTSFGNTKYIDVRKVSGGSSSTFTVSNSTVFVKDGANARYEDIGRNARIDVTSKSGNVADRVVIYSVGTGSSSNASYNFEEIRYGRIYIKNNRTGSTENYYLANNVRYLDGLSASNLRSGDPIEVRIFNNEVYEISKGSNYSNSTTGDYTFREYIGSRIYVTNNRTGLREDYYISNSLSSRWNLRTGDQIDLRVSGGDVIEISRGTSNNSGTERANFYYSGGKFEYRTSSTGSYKTVDLSLSSNNYIRIYIDGRLANRSDLPYSGDAKLTFDRSGYLTEIDVDRATSYEGTRDGTVDYVGDSIILVKLDDGGATKEFRPNIWQTSTYIRGDRVTVTFDRNGNITEIRKR